ncbi:MAG TPA: hypothetical protein PKK12_01580, partial [Candidatus Aminicenantes bacterium]|nr:hypothetical protein [Candidatus Aminicenantes bacterium]
MNRIGFALLAALLLAAGTPALAQTPTTFVLTNEGGLIDDLIAGGYGESNLYETLVALAPASNGAIPEAFLDTLAACPAGSEIFTAQLHNFSENWPVCVNSDGTISIQPIYARDVFQKEGYSTYPNPYLPGTGRELFTRATAPEHYLRAGVKEVVGGNVIYYWAFTIAWSLEKTPTTFVLSNESPGYLIDRLVGAGHGSKNLYQVLQLLQPDSGGAIPQQFLDILDACPAGSEIFTYALTQFQDPENNPICINSDGTLHVAGIYGHDYSGKSGYDDHLGTQLGASIPRFTVTIDPDHYIDSGSSNIPGNPSYQTFAIAWATAVPGSHTVSFVAGSGGTISGSTSQVVTDGDSTSAV